MVAWCRACRVTASVCRCAWCSSPRASRPRRRSRRPSSRITSSRSWWWSAGGRPGALPRRAPGRRRRVRLPVCLVQLAQGIEELVVIRCPRRLDERDRNGMYRRGSNRRLRYRTRPPVCFASGAARRDPRRLTVPVSFAGTSGAFVPCASIVLDRMKLSNDSV